MNMTGTVIWLDDDPIEIEDSVGSLIDLGLKVEVATGFNDLKRLFNLHRQFVNIPEAEGYVQLIILDIMIDGVNNITPFFNWVQNGRTAHGFAAGLVFLERVLSPENRIEADTLFGNYENVPVIVFSNRALVPDEATRMRTVENRRTAPTKVLVKRTAQELQDIVKELLNGAID